MRKFKFKLQPVLKHRQKKEDILKKELAEIRQLYEKEKQLLEQLKSKLAELQEELRVKQCSSVDASDIAVCSNYIDRVQREIETQVSRVADIAKEVIKAQERLMQASRDKKVLEKLHDKKYEEHKQESERIEQGLIDEIATVRHGRSESNSLRGTHSE